MSKVEEKIREWKICLDRYSDINERQFQGNLIRAAIRDLEEVRAEQEEQNKPVEVPQYVADWILEYKADFRTPYHSMRTATELENDVGYWLHGNKTTKQDAENQEKYLQVWLTGNYTVKQDPLYYVELPLAKTVNGFGRLAIDCKSGQHQIVHTQIDLMPNQKTKFTESEIKAKDERYWPFAVPVKED